MMIDRLNSKLHEERLTKVHQLTSGMCGDITQYRVIVAEVKVIDDILQLMKDFYVDDEHDEDGS